MLQIQKKINSGSFSNIYDVCIIDNLNNQIGLLDKNIINSSSNLKYINLDENDYIKVTKLYIKNEENDSKKYILKYGEIPLKEIEFLKISKNNLNIVKMYGEIKKNINENFFGILLEKADLNLREYINYNNVTINKDLLINLETFFTSLLDYFKTIEIVYGDWKFENILVFLKNNNEYTFKLCDFGSIMNCNKRIKNENNLNLLYCSPNLTPLIYDEIVPKYEDDYKSVCYLFLNLNKHKLPWENIDYNIINECDYKLKIFQITFNKYFLFNFKIKHDKLIYWPKKNFYFDYLY